MVKAPAGLIAAVLMSALMAPMPALAAWQDACSPAESRPFAVNEQVVGIETPAGEIVGTLAAPQGVTPRMRVLMLHGYTGSRNEIAVAGGEGMFVRAARRFARRGIEALRIDFIGSGQSDGAWEDTRFSGQARDAIRAAQWLRARGNTPVGVLGYSQGGLVALRAGAFQAAFDRVALWNPVMDPMATYGIIFGEDAIRTAASQFSEGVRGEIFGETRLRPAFFAELVDADPIADAAKVDAPVLIVTGQRDPLVKRGAELARQLAEGRASLTHILDVDAGHDLGAVNDPPFLDGVIACTADFLLGQENAP